MLLYLKITHDFMMPLFLNIYPFFPYLVIPLFFFPFIMKTLPTSQKRSLKEFSTEVEYQPRKTRRGGQKLKPITVQSKLPPNANPDASSSSVTAPSLGRPISPPLVLQGDNDWRDDISPSTKGHARKTPGQVIPST
jgi:hypothetical protein